MRTSRLLSVLTICLLAFGCNRSVIRVGVLSTDWSASKSEYASLESLVEGNDVSIEELDAERLNNRGGSYDVVWIHADTLPSFDTNQQQAVRDYVAQGGALIVSMQAVRLLNEWGIEPEPIESYTYDAVDEGYGRKVGFHAFREHPLFEGLFGGAYTWHGKQDNQCVMNGFTGDNLPKAEGAKVIATQWEYIFNRKDKKIVWQTPYGKGSILAVGGCLYYSKENFNTAILRRFTLNSIRYMAGCKSTTKERYWDYSPVEVRQTQLDKELENKTFDIATPRSLELPTTADTLSRRAKEGIYFDLATHRSMIVGQERAGIEEIWVHPFMALRDYNVKIVLPNNPEPLALSDYCPTYTITPFAVVRRYNIGGVELTETISSAVDRALTVVHYSWTGATIERIITDVKSNLRYMWPYDYDALGSIEYCWSEALNALVVCDAKREFVSLVGANVGGSVSLLGRYDGYDSQNGSTPTDKLQAECVVGYDTQSVSDMDVIFAAGSNGIDEVVDNYKECVAKPSEVVESAARYYDDYLARLTSITTPDPKINRAYRWAQISAAQFIVDTPDVGRSLMAGYASSRRGWGGGQSVSGRPGYAWYFGRDAVWSGLAFDAMGDTETVRNVLSTLIRYQQIDGKIYHELTSSGFVHFDASDATPLMVVLMADYVRSSGDVEFAKANIGAVHKAMDYCYSTDTDGDGLIEIDNVGHGWLEGGDLFGSQTEFYLCGIWQAALVDAAYLSRLCGATEQANRYGADRPKVERALEEFWNVEGGYYNYAKRRDFSFTSPLLVLTAVPVLLHATDSLRGRENAQELASPRLSNDWGVRTIDPDWNNEQLGAYGPCNVWPLFAGWASLAQYRTGLFNQGYATLRNTMMTGNDLALGRMAEVLKGEQFDNQGITLHQCWSETMALLPLLQGMVGFEPDAVEGRAKVALRLPFDWNSFEVDNLHIGSRRLSVEMQKKRGEIVCRFDSNEAVALDFELLLPPLTTVKSVTVDSVVKHGEVVESGGYCRLLCQIACNGTTELKIVCQEGVSSLASTTDPVIDEPSVGFRVLDQSMLNGQLVVTVEGRSSSTATLELYLPDGFQSIEGGANPRVLREGVVGVDVVFDPSVDRYAKKTVTVCPVRR